MCKKERYEKHRNVLVSFFAFAMLVIPNFQKLSLGTRRIFGGKFLFLFIKFKNYQGNKEIYLRYQKKYGYR